jgi:hypothetical protein
MSLLHNFFRFKIFTPKYKWVSRKIIKAILALYLLFFLISGLAIVLTNDNGVFRITAATLTVILFISHYIGIIFRTNIYHCLFNKIGFVTFEDENITFNYQTGRVISYKVKDLQPNNEFAILYINFYHQKTEGRGIQSYLGIHNQIYLNRNGNDYFCHFMIENENDANKFLALMDNWKQQKVNFTFENLRKFIENKP